MSDREVIFSSEPRMELYCGDCREILPGLTGVDAVVTDPPYGVGKNYSQYDDTQDLRSLIDPFWNEANRLTKRKLITCGIDNIWKYPEADWVICWSKPNAMVRSKVANANIWEPVLVYGCKGFGVDGVTVSIVPQDIDHPCPKPINLFVWLISKATRSGEVILDPFMGSGTTGVACARLGRRFIGIEIDRRYFDIAVDRISEAREKAANQLPFPDPPRQEPLFPVEVS